MTCQFSFNGEIDKILIHIIIFNISHLFLSIGFHTVSLYTCRPIAKCSYMCMCCRQRSVGRKKINARRTESYRKIEKLEQKLIDERRKANRYKKRYERVLKKAKKSVSPKDTPRSKTRKLLRYMNVSSEVRKTLVFHNAVMDDLRDKYKLSKTLNEKRRLACIVMGKRIMNCRLQQHSQDQLGFTCKTWQSFKRRESIVSGSVALRVRDMSVKLLQNSVRDFFLRDDVSRNTAGKKECITVNKRKMQKRFITDTLQNIHRKFLSENPLVKISYSLFCKLRPFWVLLPNASNRDTCLCKLHENLQFIVSRLSSRQILNTTNCEQLADSCACQPTSKICMYGACGVCTDKHVEFERELNVDEYVEYSQWVSVSEQKINKKGLPMLVKITRKEEVSVGVNKLVADLNKMLNQFKKHIFNIRHQYQMYRDLKHRLSENECMMHVDFAENYSCKYFKEIQSVHFGASHQQATLHNGLFYVNVNDNIDVVSFCTISDSTDHGPAAIWQYLEPVLNYMQSEHPNVDTLHCFSDGPCTQYRQKGNFFLFSTKLFEKKFKAGTWNFSEAGHGKGAADGIGAVLKRTADRLVSLHADITTPQMLFHALSATNTTVNLFFVDMVIVNKAVSDMDCSISTVPGTMNIHQVVCLKPRELGVRDVSCFCSEDKLGCQCFDIRSFCFAQTSNDVVASESMSNTVIDSIVSPPVTLPIQDLQCLNVDCNLEASLHPSILPVHIDDENSSVIVMPIDTVDQTLIGRHCLVRYDGLVFPGQIVDVDNDECLVKCMIRVGRKDNTFFWPHMEDIVWYPIVDVLTLIPEPVLISRSGRHLRIHPHIWTLYFEATA